MSAGFDLANPAFKAASLGLQRLARDLYSARSPELAEAAKVLRRTIARVLSVRGVGRPSAPGSPPYRQSGQLAGSVAQGVVDEGRRVAVLAFYAAWQEGGLAAQLGQRSTARSRKAKRELRLPSRPFIQRSIDLAAPDMVGVLVTVGSQSLSDVVDRVYGGEK